MDKIYAVIDACSGEDYDPDDPSLVFASTDLEEAKRRFQQEIDSWEEGLEDFDSNRREGEGPIKEIYECTDFYGDSHRVMKLVETALSKGDAANG